MAVEEIPIDLDKALGRFLDGEPEPEDAPALAKAMVENHRFAAEMRGLLTIDSLLQQTADADPEAFADSINTSLAAEEDATRFTQAVSNRIPFVTPISIGRRIRLLWTAAVAASIVIVAGMAWSWLATESAPHASSLPVAVMINEADAQFAEGASPSGDIFAPGSYQLQAGAVHLRFASGAEVVMRSPARFTIMDGMNMTLNEGVLRAVVPSSAHGFTVHTADVQYKDLGTEFGVVVGKQPGESQLHVFEGRVELATKQGKLLSSVEVGESVRVSGGKVEPTELKQLVDFPTAGTIGLEKWFRWRDRLDQDSSLICYFPFTPDPADLAFLKNHATNGIMSDGQIVGARWVTGRWPGKQALLFDRDGDYVSVDITGEFRQLTMSTWIYLDRCDFALNAILDSDSWRAGALHCQLTRSGEFFFGHWANRPKRKQMGPHVTAGHWTHVTAVADLDKLNTKTYIDGELAETVRLTSFPGALTPGSCRIGNWRRLLDPSSVPNRGFRGKIDELALWKRALDPKEIRDMVTAGRPSLASTN